MEENKTNEINHHITSHYRTLMLNDKENIIVIIKRMIQKYIYNENSKKIRAQECSDDNIIAGMASTEIH